MGRLFYIGVGAVGAIALRENSEMVNKLSHCAIVSDDIQSFTGSHFRGASHEMQKDSDKDFNN